MKIGILSLPFNYNYGGILQTYALQTSLQKMGHKVETVNRSSKISYPIKMKILSFGKRFLLKNVLRKNVVVRFWTNEKEEKLLRKNTDRFIQENIKTTKFLKSESEFSELEKLNFDAYIVGSDQVWRPRYSPNIENHFLKFTGNKTGIKRISYAASFGVENWEYTAKQTQSCSALAKQFNAISVREDSAVELCKNHLQVDSVQTLDPTLLLSIEEYTKLVEKENTTKNKGTLLMYVLDLAPEKRKIVQTVIDQLKLTPFSTMPESTFRDVGKKNIDKCIFPSVENWIRGFMDAEFVITDSFHGTAFSIIFNKPFLSIGNPKRGMTRFTSLLKMLDLEDRLIQNFDDTILEKIKKPIDFKKVNGLLDNKREEAFSFLKNALK